MTEAELLRTVVDMARIFGWRIHHCRPGRTNQGWRTPITGDPGFPDLVMARRAARDLVDRLIFIELKSDKGELSPHQQIWRDTLDRAGVPYYLWRPQHLRDGEIEQVLR